VTAPLSWAPLPGVGIVTVNVVGEVDDSLWLPMVILMIGSLVIAAGLVLGVAHLAARRLPNAPS
jgi:hypothetical protein